MKIYLYLISLITALLSGSCFACSCLTSSDREFFESSSLVFIGTVIKSELVSDEGTQLLDTSDTASLRVNATIEVKQAIKGEPSEQEQVIDYVANGANCGVGLLTGGTYLFYLLDDRQVSLCSGTRLFNEFTDAKLIENLLSY